MAIEDYPDELKHYGVLGMKWGVRHDYKPVGRRRGSKYQSSSQRSSGNKSMSKSKRKGLSDKQKRAIAIGAAAVGVALLAYGGYRLSKSGKLDELSKAGLDKFNQMMGKNKGPIDSNLKDYTGKLKTIDHKMSREANLKAVNPEYSKLFSKNYTGSHMNCGNTTYAWELRQRGFNVEANMNETGMYPEHVGQFFKGLHSDSIKTLDFDSRDFAKVSKYRKAEAITNTIKNEIAKSYPDGARGNVYIPFDGSAHFMYWSNNKGIVKFDDPQSANRIKFEQIAPLIDTTTSGGKTYGVRTTRLDDLEINEDNIFKIIKNVGAKQDTSFETGKIAGDNFVLDQYSNKFTGLYKQNYIDDLAEQAKIDYGYEYTSNKLMELVKK